MKYLIFATELQAQAYADSALATLPRGANDTTTVWDVPHLISGSRWVVASIDDSGETWNSDWNV
jgi:hypothetical protein